MSFNIFAKILVLALIVCLAYSQKQFTGSCTITNDPAMNPGSSVTVDPFYYDDTNQLWRLDYPNLRDPNTKALGFKEIYDFQKQVYYQLCSVCQTYSNPLPTPKFYKETTDIRASSRFTFSLNGQACDPWQKINPQDAGIAYVWVTASGLTCRAERTDGLTYNFDITKTKVGAPAASVFTLPTTSNCPNRPLCSAPIDLVLVLDQSGSIHRDEWADLTKFATGIVNSFVVGPNNTHIGLVYFSGTQYATGENPASCCGLSDPALPLNFDNDTIIKFLLNHEQTGGHTCINCGIKTATTYEPNRNRPIQVPKIMLVLTDGFNNRMTNFFDIDIQNAKNEGWNMFAIGVRNASMDQLNQIASKPNQVYFIDNFDALETISKSVVYSLCGAFPTLTPCGPGCKGKCACGGKCVCPQCNNPDLCTESNCTENVAGSGCLFTPTFCDPLANNGDLCKVNKCDKTNGKCTLINKNCSALLPDSCYTQVCDPKIGCTVRDSCPPIQNIPGTQTQSLCFDRLCSGGVCGSSVKACGSANACAVQSCDDKLGCISTPINCDDGDACTLDTCDRNQGCLHTKLQCPSQEFLNSPAGKNNLCLTFTCDKKIGCTSTPKTCDDNNVCTSDSCNPTTGQCVNTPISCPTPTNKCLVASCDVKAGCVLAAKNCDDGKFCTTDSCNPTTGQCVNTPITCAPNATLGTCADQVCEESARGCVSKPRITCPQPADKCQATVCTNGACTTTVALSCPITNLCTVGICDPVNGCLVQPKICNDNNNCTSDTCDAATGNCVFTPIPNCINCTNCVPTNPCITKTCLNGTCVESPFVCPPNLCGTVTATVVGNECRCIPRNVKTCPTSTTACGEQVCNPNTGQCEFTNTRICNDNNPCTTDTCVVVGGKATCNFTQITCPGDSPCSRKKCVVQNGQPTCVANDVSNTLNCTANGCSTAKCNPTTGQCQFTPKPCPNVSNTTCARNICNPITGICEANVPLTCPTSDPAGCGTNGVCIFNDVTNTQTCKYNPLCNTDKNDGCLTVTCKPQTNGQPGICQENKFSCDDNNPCTNEVCQPDGVDVNGVPKTKCVSTPVICPPSTDPCSLNLCTNVNGVAKCVLTAVVCNSTSKCLSGKCFVENGKGVCKYNETNCGVPDKCTNYNCDPVLGCKKILKCDDKNPCTDDLCDPKTGTCTFVQKKCNSTSPCKKGLCDPNIGCVERPIDCAKDRNITALDACHFVVCVNTTGCTVAVVPNSLDKCGTCNATACALRNKSKVPAGAIAGAVIGGAIIAGIIALGIGLFAASQGAAAFTPGTQVQMMGGSNNPLYTDGDTGGTNPFDDNDYVPL